MSAVRLNITLPQDVVQTLKELAGPREQSHFIADSVRFYARKIKRKKFMEELRKEYQEAAEEGLQIAQEFDPTLTEGLDDENY